MSTKIAMTAHLPEHQECTACHCYTSAGYMLKDNSLSRFVCEECYSGMSSEYPLAAKVVEINRRTLSSLVPEGKKPGFQAGYLMGKKDVAGSDYKITVSSFLDSIQADRGTTCFFGKDDALRIRKISKDQGLSVVGIYRTSPSGSPDFNLLDNKTLDDMLLDIVYMIIGGCNEIQIAVKDKHGASDEIGVVIS